VAHECRANDLGLFWHKTDLICETEAAAKEASFFFLAENRSTTPVRIRSLKASCGCTKVTFNREQILAGETVTIEGTVSISTHEESRVIQILVETTTAVTPLSVQVIKKMPVRAIPRALIWSKEEALTTKHIIVQLWKQSPPLLITSIAADSAKLHIDIEVLAPSTEFRLKVTPKQSAGGASPIKIAVEDAAGGKHEIVAYAYIKSREKQTNSQPEN
jgi:hypothetical protein